MEVPLCSYFGKCNGCTLQHVAYDQQKIQKADRVRATLQIENLEVLSGDPYGYRNRMDFFFYPGGIGLRSKENKVMDIESCVIADEKVNRVLAELRNFFKEADVYDPIKKAGTWKGVMVRSGVKETAVVFSLSGSSSRLAEAVEKIERFAQQSSGEHIGIQYGGKERAEELRIIKGSLYLEKVFLGKSFLYPIQGFFQNNHKVAEGIHISVNNVLQKYKSSETTLWDVYSGVGCFGIVNASLFKDVLLIEEFPEAVKAAQANVVRNNVTNVKVVCLDASRLKKISAPGNLIVLVDPPRSGMDEKTIIYLKKIKPKVIMYISCNYPQLAKDLKKFKDYKLKSAVLCDLFPQTAHCEVIAELVRTEEVK